MDEQIGMELVGVPTETFVMGSPEDGGGILSEGCRFWIWMGISR